uniref:hypothetical protein n=1 Tax=Paractinoplanes polyasparticus TaxID=2856853 RepID=UPI001C85F4D4|nr:hypothetical protein [Actinoplanes polyasparticus]
MDDPGSNTVELSPRTPPAAPPANHPDDKERRLRRFGTLSLISGIAIEVALIIAALTMAVISDNNAYSNPTAELFGVLTHLAFVSLAAGFIAIGGVERLTRRHRAQTADNTRELAGIRQASTTVADLARATERNRILLERLALDNEERYGGIMAYVAVLPGRFSELADSYVALVDRLKVIEEAVQHIPDYSKGVKDGLQLRRGYIDPDSTDPE